jgi:hypothetical protein
VSAAVASVAGATSRLPAWWGANDWLELEVAGALDERPELLRVHHVSRAAVLKTAEKMAAYADHRTGRGCRPTNELLVTLCQCSLSTVQRARRVLKALGLVRVVVRGRSFMTRAERLQAWRRGSTARMVAAEFALCSRSRRAPKESTSGLERGARFVSAGPLPVDGDTPPGAHKVSASLQSRSGLLRRRTERGGTASRPAHTEGVDAERARSLAEATRGRIGWLRGVSWRRLAPTLARFARAGWSDVDVALAVADALAARGWRVPANLKTPAAYLAGLLRAVDVDDRPTVQRAAHLAWLREQAAAERAARRAQVLAIAGRCAHGVAANGAGQPSRGVAPCGECTP